MIISNNSEFYIILVMFLLERKIRGTKTALFKRSESAQLNILFCVKRVDLVTGINLHWES